MKRWVESRQPLCCCHGAWPVVRVDYGPVTSRMRRDLRSKIVGTQGGGGAHLRFERPIVLVLPGGAGGSSNELGCLTHADIDIRDLTGGPRIGPIRSGLKGFIGAVGGVKKRRMGLDFDGTLSRN